MHFGSEVSKIRPKISELESIKALRQSPRVRSLQAPLPPAWQQLLQDHYQWGSLSYSQDLEDELLAHVFRDLKTSLIAERFPHAYWIEGISSFFTPLLIMKQRIFHHKFDYAGLKSWPGFVPVDSLENVPFNSSFYISQPFSGLGCYLDLTELEKRSDLDVVIDMAFWGTVPAEELIFPPQTSLIALSFSKNMGLWPMRLGLILSKSPIAPLQSLKEASYLPVGAMKALQILFRQHSLFSLQNHLRPYQIEICKSLGLLPSLCVLAGHESPWSYRRSLTWELHEAIRNN